MNRGGVIGLGVANAAALAAALVATLVYGRWLQPAEFAAWAASLALARAALLLVDGGLKTALVCADREPPLQQQARLQRLSAVVAVFVVVALAAVLLPLWRTGRIGADAAMLAWVCPSAYLLAHPTSFVALARLERAQRFAAIGRVEGAATVVEFALPALLLAAAVPAWSAFAVAVVLARGARGFGIVHAARSLPAATAASEPLPLARWLRAGFGVQALVVLSLLRDNLHLWLLAPWFGAEWAGRYAFAFTACTLASQVFVQTAARVALPALRSADSAARWPRTLAQIRTLAMLTLPPLVLLPAALAAADAALWQGRWHAAIALVPWLLLRMLPSVATTPLGALLLVVRGPAGAARAHAAWTAVEIGVAAACLLLWGPVGLAVSAAVAAWPGLLLFCRAAGPPGGARTVVSTLLRRPSLLVALPIGAAATLVPAAACLLPLAWLAEPSLRRRLQLQSAAVAR